MERPVSIDETMTSVSILIVNWNGRHLLQECLESLLVQTFQDFEVILVDNGSNDGSRELLHACYPWVKRIELENNTGFATANNIGLPYAVGEYIVTLNNDTRAEPEWLAELVRVAETDSKIGMVGSRTCVWDQPDIIDTLGGRICRDGMSRGAFREQSFTTLNLPDIVPILYPSPCAALYRRQMLEDVGFFDDDFFAYAEDTDLGLRARWAGWGAVAATDALVHHRYSATGGRLSPMKVFLVERNHYWVAIKNFPLNCLISLPFWGVIRFLVQLKCVFAGRGTGEEFLSESQPFGLVKATARGQLAALARLPDMLRKRQVIMKSRRLSDAQMCDLLSAFRLNFRDLFDLK